MKLLITIIIALALAALIGVTASQNEGYMVFSIADWTVQTSVNFFIICLILLCIVFYIFMRLLLRIGNAGKDYEKYRERKNSIQNADCLSDGMTALIEGDWRKAESLLKKGAKYSKNPTLNYLGAARAAQQLGETSRRDKYLSLAHEFNEATPVSVGITQAKLQMELNEKEQALATLSKLHEENPKHSEVNKMLLTSYIEMKDWNKVLELLPLLKKQSALTADMIKAYELQAYAGLLEVSGFEKNEQHLGNTWLSIPKKLRSEFYLIDVYVQQRLQFDQHHDSEILLRNAIKKDWDTRLVRLYGLVKGNDLTMQLAFAEKLLNDHANDPALLLTLGRLCIRNQLWGKARSYFEQCAEYDKSPELFYELAQLLQQQLNEPELAANYHRLGLSLATDPAKNQNLQKRLGRT